MLYGHSAAVTCVALCPQLDLVFSAGAEGGLLSHTISTGRSEAYVLWMTCHVLSPGGSCVASGRSY